MEFLVDRQHQINGVSHGQIIIQIIDYHDLFHFATHISSSSVGGTRQHRLCPQNKFVNTVLNKTEGIPPNKKSISIGFAKYLL